MPGWHSAAAPARDDMSFAPLHTRSASRVTGRAKGKHCKPAGQKRHRSTARQAGTTTRRTALPLPEPCLRCQTHPRHPHRPRRPSRHRLGGGGPASGPLSRLAGSRPAAEVKETGRWRCRVTLVCASQALRGARWDYASTQQEATGQLSAPFETHAPAAPPSPRSRRPAPAAGCPAAPWRRWSAR